MQKQWRRTITICLAIAMLFSGLYFERLKITSYFAESNFPGTMSVIREAEPTAVVAHVRREKEEYRSIFHSQERKSEKTDLMETLIAQCMIFCVCFLSMMILFVFLWEYLILGNIESFIIKMISYIHEKDGDKVQVA